MDMILLHAKTRLKSNIRRKLVYMIPLHILVYASKVSHFTSENGFLFLGSRLTNRNVQERICYFRKKSKACNSWLVVARTSCCSYSIIVTGSSFRTWFATIAVFTHRKNTACCVESTRPTPRAEVESELLMQSVFRQFLLGTHKERGQVFMLERLALKGKLVRCVYNARLAKNRHVGRTETTTRVIQNIWLFQFRSHHLYGARRGSTSISPSLLRHLYLSKFVARGVALIQLGFNAFLNRKTLQRDMNKTGNQSSLK